MHKNLQFNENFKLENNLLLLLFYCYYGYMLEGKKARKMTP